MTTTTTSSTTMAEKPLPKTKIAFRKHVYPMKAVQMCRLLKFLSILLLNFPLEVSLVLNVAPTIFAHLLQHIQRWNINKKKNPNKSISYMYVFSSEAAEELKDFILRSVRRKERSVPRSNRLKLERLTSRRGPRVAFVMFWLGGASLVFLTFLRFCKYLKLPHWTGLCSMPGGLIASLWVCQMDETMGGDQRVLLCQQLARPGRRWSITS